ncbi:calmodulin-like protein 12 [Oopsacas minuta]|uniref:Calmodulin-like protein 12 n=1 Tax=Oopsacas minuta TaxID=111878 RepID=A0AAV7K730_9METZ|nr:calmodulin-like protein 12 [Oopsacas minuta]
MDNLEIGLEKYSLEYVKTQVERMTESIDNYFTPQELEMFRLTFNIFDKDNDSKLHLEEAKVALDKIGEKLTQEDYVTLLVMCECVNMTAIEFPIFKLLVFKKRELEIYTADTIDNFGGLNSREELQEIMQELGANKTDAEFDQMFRGAKMNEDNEITLLEYAINSNSNFSNTKHQSKHKMAQKVNDDSQLAKEYGITEEQVGEYREAFRLFDKDGDGTITCKELLAVLNSLGQKCTEKEAKEMIAEVDTDQNETIELGEFIQIMRKKHSKKTKTEELKEAFKCFDKNGDGHISHAELKEVMKSMGQEMDDSQIEQMIIAADTNSDGEIDFEEFRRMMSES